MIKIRVDKTAYRPGDTIHGSVHWEGLPEPDLVDLRLVWHTKGKGTQASEMVRHQVIEMPGWSGTKEFQIIAPEWPHSFSGKLLTVQWKLETAGAYSETSPPIDLIISPSGSELQMPYDNETGKDKYHIRNLMPQ